MTTHLFASTWDEALHGAMTRDAVIVGGGTSVQPWLTSTGTEPSVLVYLRDVPGAWSVVPADSLPDATAHSAGRLRVGAMVSVTDPILRPLFGGTEPSWFATPAVRRRATVVGNVVSPLGPRELVPVLAACGAQLVVMGEYGTRMVEVTSIPMTGLAAGEIACGLELCDPERVAFRRVALRPSVSRSEVAVAAAVGDGCGATVSIGVGGPTLRLEGAEECLRDPGGAEDFADACVRSCLAAGDVDPKTLQLVSGMAERVHRDLHNPKGV
ncbi:FAD binding domain-containing protein [Rhodococcus sp. Z13]|uniref:FAD binding domain-containing protein n=1 Tax=Rhodococcus sacchari TaxID=2962047 RepID=A0ACD4DEM7_9NOCA|nr:FAD binding domain-containing protein [Rhodococcus sp. Z13]UYP18461.1 FAD binding domain-containing protein [Rhodococcus sp. Z13]